MTKKLAATTPKKRITTCPWLLDVSIFITVLLFLSQEQLSHARIHFTTLQTEYSHFHSIEMDTIIAASHLPIPPTPAAPAVPLLTPANAAVPNLDRYVSFCGKHMLEQLLDDTRDHPECPTIAIHMDSYTRMGKTKVCELLAILVLEDVKSHLPPAFNRPIKMYTDMTVHNDYALITFHWVTKSFRKSIGRDNLKRATQLCSICDIWKPAHQFKYCGRCNATYYCSPLCQRQDWPVHKKCCVQKGGQR